jgi:hypothetical protein
MSIFNLSIFKPDRVKYDYRDTEFNCRKLNHFHRTMIWPSDAFTIGLSTARSAATVPAELITTIESIDSSNINNFHLKLEQDDAQQHGRTNGAVHAADADDDAGGPDNAAAGLYRK